MKVSHAKLESANHWIQTNKAFALILVMLIIVLTTALLLAYAFHSGLDRRAARNYAASIAAADAARSGMDFIIYELGQEMRQTDSVVDENKTVFTEITSTNILPENTVGQATLPNLIKISQSDQGLFGTNRPVASGSLISSASRNQRRIPLERLSSARFGSLDELNTPQWYLLGENGFTQQAESSVRARLAFAIYDVSGLLDINVAGAPSSLSLVDKGGLPFADLSVIGVAPNSIDSGALLNFRNPASLPNYEQFARVDGPRNGFLKVARGDNTFLGRQDLINLSNRVGIPDPTLSYLTHFSRSLNAPSWGPELDAGGSFDYRANRDTPASINRLTPNVRVQSAFTRLDGSTAVPGEPLITKRFPLSRLRWLGINGPTAEGSEMALQLGLTPAELIRRTFGLLRTGAHWEYEAKGSGNGIATAKEITDANREPEFFEILKMAILSGSLGKSGGGSFALDDGTEESSDMQIIRIGANFIDQFDENNYPTRIAYSPGGLPIVSSGIENLPYFGKVYPKHYYTANGTTMAPPFENRFIPEVWNPHLSTPGSSNGPTSVRVRILSGALEEFRLSGQNDTNTLPVLPAPALDLTSLPALTISETEISDSRPRPFVVADGASGQGFHIWTYTSTTGTPTNATTRLRVANLIFGLEYLDSGGNWRIYSTFGGTPELSAFSGLDTMGPFNGNYALNTSNRTSSADPQWWARSDPRTGRFGIGLGTLRGSQANSAGATLRPNTANPILAGYEISRRLPFDLNPGDGWQQPRARLALLSQAGLDAASPIVPPPPPQSNMVFADNDGIFRPADGYLGVNPYADPVTGSAQDIASRSLVLQRKPLSIGEIGYVHRDQPWKTLDLFTSRSADAGLLDFFCLNESEISMTAGVVSPNSPFPQILQSLMAGAGYEPFAADAGNGAQAEKGILTHATAETMANGMVVVTNATPLLNRSELSALVESNILATTTDRVKGWREASIRSLADATQTRTWNLMIDIFAQSGFYPEGTPPTEVDGFIVEGQRRYWLHLAMDRFTGEVIDSHLELVK